MKHIQMIILGLVLVIAAGCGSKSTTATTDVSSSPAPISPWIGDDPEANNDYLYGSGSTVEFKPTDLTTFNTYVATQPLNYPTNFKINVQLQHVGDMRYGGRVSISYTDNNQNRVGVLQSGLGRNESFYMSNDDNTLQAYYNFWYNGPSGLPIYTGFFQDQIGSTVLVLETIAAGNQSDGQPGALTVKGSVYFKNFPVVIQDEYHDPFADRMCWFMTRGPYDCRSTTIMDKTSATPSDGYRLLGTFDNLDVKAAFALE